MLDLTTIADVIAAIPASIGYYPNEDICCIRHTNNDDGTPRILGVMRVGIDTLITDDTVHSSLRACYDTFTAASSAVGVHDTEPIWSVVAISSLHPTRARALDASLRTITDILPGVTNMHNIPVVTPAIIQDAAIYAYTPGAPLPAAPIATVPSITGTQAFHTLVTNTGMLPMLSRAELYAQCTTTDHGFNPDEYNDIVRAVREMHPLDMCGSRKALAGNARDILTHRPAQFDSHDAAMLLTACVDYRTRNTLLVVICDHDPDDAQAMNTNAAGVLAIMLQLAATTPREMPVLHTHVLAMLAVAALAAGHNGLASAAIGTANQLAQTIDERMSTYPTPQRHIDTDVAWIERLHTTMTYGDHAVTMRALHEEGVRAWRALG